MVSDLMNSVDCSIEWVPDKPVRGMWHNGPNPGWLTVTHKPTLQAVRLYGMRQHKMRARAFLLLELMLDEGETGLPSFPERIQRF